MAKGSAVEDDEVLEAPAPPAPPGKSASPKGFGELLEETIPLPPEGSGVLRIEETVLLPDVKNGSLAKGSGMTFLAGGVGCWRGRTAGDW